MSESSSKNPNLQNRSPHQLAILAQAREKAKIVRAENAKIRNQEKELIKLEKDKAKEEKKKDIKNRYAKLKDEPIEAESAEPIEEAESAEPEPTPSQLSVPNSNLKPKTKPKTKKPIKKKVVVVDESDSSSEEEEEVVYVKKPKKSKPKTKKVKKIIYESSSDDDEVQSKPTKPTRKYIKPEHESLYHQMFTIT
jgi:hypothetical protein